MWGIQLVRSKDMSLARQIFQAIRENIITGKLTAGEALPSTRELAGELGVSRNTACEAYEMLMAEGFVSSRQGAATRVAVGLVLERQPRSLAQTNQPENEVKRHITVDFKTGQPDLTLFPWRLWRQMLHEGAAALPREQLNYSGPKGYEPLCEEIACWLFRSRNIEAAPKDIFITSGSTQAFYLLADLLHKEGRSFMLERPSHPAVHAILAGKGYPLCWTNVDESGMMVEAIDGQAVSAVYVTPSHQFPLGGILPAGRRAALLRQAEANDFYIIEDDYDSEFRYGGAPVSPLYSMDASRVIYTGTFSKTLFPALRLGFTILPEALQEEWRLRRTYLDVQNPILEQAALAEFLRTRRMDYHLQCMRRVYGRKRQALLASINSIFGDDARLWGDAAGLHLALQLPGTVFADRFLEESREAGIRIYPVSRYCPGTPEEYQDTLLLGYGHLTQQQIREGLEWLHRWVKSNKSDL